MECSAKTCAGITAAFEDLVDAIALSPQLGRRRASLDAGSTAHGRGGGASARPLSLAYGEDGRREGAYDDFSSCAC